MSARDWEAFKRTADRRVTYFEVYSEPDGMGRQSFAILWFDPNHHGGPGWRGQHFRARLDEYLKKYKRTKITRVKS